MSKNLVKDVVRTSTQILSNNKVDMHTQSVTEFRNTQTQTVTLQKTEELCRKNGELVKINKDNEKKHLAEKFVSKKIFEHLNTV